MATINDPATTCKEEIPFNRSIRLASISPYRKEVLNEVVLNLYIDYIAVIRKEMSRLRKWTHIYINILCGSLWDTGPSLS